MISGADILAISGCASPADVECLSLSGRGIKCIDPSSFERFSNISQLDLSRNALKTVPDLKLPKLKKLNVEENLIQDLTFLRNYPSLTELLVTGNPILFADRNIAVSLLPNLKLIDGSDCQPLRNLEANGDKKILHQISRVWESYFQDRMTPGMSKQEIADLKVDFLRHLRRAFIECNEFPPKFRKFKVEMLGEALFEGKLKLHSCTAGPSTPRKQASPRQERGKGTALTPRTPRSLSTGPERRTPAKQQTPLKSYLSTKSSARQALFVNEASSPKKKTKLSEEPTSDEAKRGSPRKAFKSGAEAIAFLRCHSTDRNDSATQVWQAAFEPAFPQSGKSSALVATCGGRIINFIDCSSKTVLKRYKHENLKEELFCLAWTMMIVEGRLTKVLAAAGKSGEILLIHPEQLVCYHTFRAHAGCINCLTFCPSEPTWLLSGSFDHKICLWNIGTPVIPSYRTKVEKLLCLDAGSEVLQMCISTKHNLLMAACHAGLFGWDFDKSAPVKTRRLPHMEFQLKSSEGKVEREPLVDGLILLSDDTVVSKCAGSATISSWNLASSLESRDRHSHRRQKISVEYQNLYRWSSTNVDYLYPSAASNVLACGDDTGSVWLYDMSAASGGVSEPARILAWPGSLECDGFKVRTKENKININSVTISADGHYLVACTDVNVVCIWKLLY